jgi:SAM-dependent methyltransferase
VGSCPICGCTERREHGGRPEARCRGCDSLERHRTLVQAVGEELEPRGSGRCLELGPRSAKVFGGYLSRRGWEYTACDRWELRSRVDPEAFGTFIDHDADATDLFFARSGSFELFIAQHVIEEIDDYHAALDEVARVLEPGGRALLEIPLAAGRERTVRQPPDQYDNVWSFGSDLLDQLRARFDELSRVELAEGGYSGVLFIGRRSP